MKAAIYIRTKTNKKDYSSQFIHLSNFASINGWQSEIFSETLNDMRSQHVKKELLSRLYRNEFDVIIVYKFADWSIRLSDLLKEINLVTSKGKRFFSYSENFDSASPTGRIFLMTLSILKEFEQSLNQVSTEEFTGCSIPVRDQGENNLSGTVFRANLMNGLKNTNKSQYDIIDLHEACVFTGYSKHTLYQMTSLHTIPFIKRPGGRKIFFSKKALENWLMNGVEE